MSVPGVVDKKVHLRAKSNHMGVAANQQMSRMSQITNGCIAEGKCMETLPDSFLWKAALVAATSTKTVLFSESTEFSFLLHRMDFQIANALHFVVNGLQEVHLHGLS